MFLLHANNKYPKRFWDSTFTNYNEIAIGVGDVEAYGILWLAIILHTLSLQQKML